MNAPLFLTSLPRSGGTMLAKALSCHPEVTVASDPFLPLFRSLRNAMLRSFANDRTCRGFDPSICLQDYYFSKEQIAVMDLIQDAPLKIDFDPNEWESLSEVLQARAGFECPDLLPFLPHIQGKTYRDFFRNGLDIIFEHRGKGQGCRAGFKDVWIIEFFSFLAKAFSKAKFLVLFRDPRATIYSMLAMKTLDPSQLGHTLSYARHWRKMVSFFFHLSRSPLLSDRMKGLKFEGLISKPEEKFRDLCVFLEIPFHSKMADPSSYKDVKTGKVWQVNSNFEGNTQGFNRDSLARWKGKLDSRIVRLVDFVCGPEMSLMGYQPESSFGDTEEPQDVLEYFIENGKEHFSWRSDRRNPQKDFSLEVYRRSLLRRSTRPALDEIRGAFLFEDMYDELKHRDFSLRDEPIQK